jgi:threonine/homoserine/homoserine lactone efflux protein
MPAFTIIVFFLGMMTLAFTVIVVETWWVVALVGIIHITGSGVLMWLLIRQLGREEDDEPAQGESRSIRHPPSATGR